MGVRFWVFLLNIANCVFNAGLLENCSSICTHQQIPLRAQRFLSEQFDFFYYFLIRKLSIAIRYSTGGRIELRSVASFSYMLTIQNYCEKSSTKNLESAVNNLQLFALWNIFHFSLILIDCTIVQLLHYVYHSNNCTAGVLFFLRGGGKIMTH